MQKLFLTFFGAGLLRPAPGTWGSLFAGIVAVFILIFFNETTLFLLGIFIFVVSIKMIDEYEKNSGEHDSSQIVIDEVVGVFVTLSIAVSAKEIFALKLTPLIAGFNSFSFLAVILGVVFFRVFDIWKPSIIGRVDRDVKGGIGVMLDDVIAGFFAGIATLIVMSAMVKIGLQKFIF